MKSARLAIALAASIAVSSAPAAPISIIGDWEIVEAAPGPWTSAEERPRLTAAGKHLVKAAISFQPKQIVSK